MPAKRELTMRQLRQMLRLHHDGLGAREIGRRLGVARSTIQDNLKRAPQRPSWLAVAAELTDEALERRLFAQAAPSWAYRRRIEPDWAALVREMKRPGVNLSVLWEEYRRGPSRRLRLQPVLRAVPGVRAPAVADDAPDITSPATRSSSIIPARGSRSPIRSPARSAMAEIFVAVLGASNYTYAEATWTQTLPDWIGAHVRMFRVLRGSPRLLVPDNLKSGSQQAIVLRPRGQPHLRRDGHALQCRHAAGASAQAARQGDGRSRSPLRPVLHPRPAAPSPSSPWPHATPRSLVARADEWPRDAPAWCQPPRTVRDASNGPPCSPLPATDYEYAEWRLARVGLDYHVEVDGFFYSVPHALIREQVDARATARTIEVFHRGKRVAAHRPPLWRTAAWHRARPHAERASAICRMDARALSAIGALDRPEHRGADHRRAGQPAASRARLPHLPRRAAPVPRPRSVPAPRRSSPRRRDRRADLQERRLDPQTPSTTRRRPRTARRAARQHPRPPLLPLRRPPLLTHPTLDLSARARPARHGQGLPGARTTPRSRSLDTPSGWASCSSTRSRCASRSASRPRQDRQTAPSGRVEDVDYRTPRGLDRTLFLKLAGCDWIREHRHCLLTGPAGVGKSWLACALGYKACRENLSVLYQRVPRLFAALALARGDGRYAKLLKQLARVDLLILDDWGPEPLPARTAPRSAGDRRGPLRHRSLIITSQVPIDRWYEIIGNPTLADAILDRIIHNAHRIELAAKACASGAAERSPVMASPRPDLSPAQQRARGPQGRYAPLSRWPAAILDRPLRALPFVGAGRDEGMGRPVEQRDVTERKQSLCRTIIKSAHLT